MLTFPSASHLEGVWESNFKTLRVESVSSSYFEARLVSFLLLSGFFDGRGRDSSHIAQAGPDFPMYPKITLNSFLVFLPPPLELNVICQGWF